MADIKQITDAQPVGHLHKVQRERPKSDERRKPAENTEVEETSGSDDDEPRIDEFV